MAKLCEHGYFLEVAPRSCPKCRTDIDLIQREEIATLRALTMPMMPGGLNMMVKTEETYGTQPADGAGVRILEVTAPAITGTPEYAMTIEHTCQHCNAMTAVTLRGEAGTPIGEAISALAAAMAGE